jgi:uncharacterized repeat protein (TIGR02543 family)
LANGTTFNRKINGTVVNPRVIRSVDPQTQNGYDNAIGLDGKTTWGGAAYNDSVNVAPSNFNPKKSLIVANGSSVVSSISTSKLPESGSYPQIHRFIVLTVVDLAPSAGSFRPPMIGTDKTHRWNKDQLNYDILKKLTPVENTPTLTSVENEFAIPWTILFTGNWTQNMSPEQMPNYGRDQAHAVSRALLSLHLDYDNALKEKLYVSLVQYGIDIYGFVQDGGFTRTSGGLNGGRKASLVLAAAALNDPFLKEWANANKKTTHPDWGNPIDIFHEDGQMFNISQFDVGRTVTQDGGYRATYTQDMVTIPPTPEWGGQHNNYPNYDGSNWNAPYRAITNSAHVGNALGIKLLTGGEAIWNNPIFFNYYFDRVWDIEGAGTYEQQSLDDNKIPRFDFSMMKAYKNLVGTTTPTSNTLTTSVNGSGLISGTGILCGAGQTDCSQSYESGTSVSLLATSSVGYKFDGWTGACTGTNTTCIISMTQAKSVTANFSPITVTPTTPVITTPLNNTIFPSNTTNVAVSWTGDATNYIVRYITTNNSTGVATTNTANTSNKTYSVQVTQGNSYKFYVAAGTETNKSPEANVNFSIEKQVSQTYTLTATTTGTGNGTIAGNLTNYKEGDIAILTATPDSSSTFNGWSGCTSVSNNVCSINMTGTTIIKNVTATFNIKVSTSLTISSPTNQVYPSSIKSITAKWTATPAPLSYFVTVTDLTDPNKNRKTNNTYVYKDLYTSTSLKFSVSRGHSYKLSVSTGTAYNHGPETTVNFSVAR